jgi:diketogulonate reductase-like aldo/keto reductase
MVSLNDISKIGIGTWGIAGFLHHDKSVDTESQLNALKRSYDLGANYIDCSLKYADGVSLQIIKQIIQYAGRENLFISAKLEQFIQQPEDVSNQLDYYLESLSIDSIDLLQLHAPSFTKLSIYDTYREVGKLINSGRVMYAGASNFNVDQLREAAVGCGRQLAVHESLFNFKFRQNEDAGILRYCNKSNIKFVAYQPLHRGKTEASGNTLLRKLANKYNKTQPQIILNWLTRKGIIPLVRSDNMHHLEEDYASVNFAMEEYDYTLIDEYRDAETKNISVDWSDQEMGNSIYQIANKY